MAQTKSGFTLVELLVVIAIIGILMGLLIPAVNSARESARRAECANNIRQHALAAIQYENSKGHLPHWVDKYGFFDPNGDGTPGPDASDPGALGNYAGAVPTHAKIGGYGVGLLPWLDAQPTYEHWTQDRYSVVSDGNGQTGEASGGLSGDGFHPFAAPNLAIFQCPSSPSTEGTHGRNNYIPNNGMSHLYSRDDAFVALNTVDAANDDLNYVNSQGKANGCFTSGYNGFFGGTLLAPAPDISLDDMSDGQGNTMLFSENVQATPWHRPGFLNDADLATATGDIPSSIGLWHSRFTNGAVWHFEDPNVSVPAPSGAFNSDDYVPVIYSQHKINGGGDTAGESVFNLIMDDVSLDAVPSLARPSSAHPDGVNCGFADGATRFVPANVDYRVYQAMMTPRGKSSNVPWPEFVLTGELD